MEPTIEPYIGYRAIEGALKRGVPGELVYSRRSKRIDNLVRFATQRKIPTRSVSPGEMNDLCGVSEHRGIAFFLKSRSGERSAQSHPPSPTLSTCIADCEDRTAVAVILDSVTDPHNLGAVLRSVDLFSVDFVVIPRHRTAHYGPVVAQSSAGAAEFVQLCEVPNIVRAMEELKQQGFWIYGADMGGSPVWDMEFNRRSVVVLGSEGGGLHRLVRERCDDIIAIPSRGHVDSFNVSVAAGILLYEVRRQHGFAGV